MSTRFRVSRTSEYNEEACPLVGAVKGVADRWDVRTCKSPDEFDRSQGHREGKWLDRGTDHVILRGPRGGANGIARKVGTETAWYVDVEDLPALLALGAEHGALIVSHDDNGTPTIEVYDGWRE